MKREAIMRKVMSAVLAIIIVMSCAGSVFAADIRELTAAAEAGDAQTQYILGVRYEHGGDVEMDYGKAAEWYTKAAEQGHALAQLRLGILYENGEGVEKDYAKAIEWYTRAEKQGDVEAQYRLGIMYELGNGVEKDYAKAVEWYTRAADQGHVLAQWSLGGIYNRGEIVKKDPSAAYMWYLVVSMTDPGFENIERFIEMTGKDLSAAQIKEAEREAKAKVEEINRRKSRKNNK